jgi:anti-sigma factor ChrR (cupin superfamily)
VSSPTSHPPVLNHLLEGLDLAHPGKWQAGLPWKPFHQGVEIHRLYGDGLEGPSAALLRFHPGGSIPHHFHTGYEHILVLQGSQADEHGEIPAGGFRIHPPGSSHSVTSAAGCIVLAIYERPVKFTPPTPVAPPGI